LDLAGFLETKKTIKKESQTRGEENVYGTRKDTGFWKYSMLRNH